jgi:hypothetical protein
VRSIRHLFHGFRPRRARHAALALLAISNQLVIVAFAAAPAVVAIPALHATRSVCAPDGDCTIVQASTQDTSDLSLPGGTDQCPASGFAAACYSTSQPADSYAGSSDVPAGAIVCPTVDGKTLPATPAACAEPTVDGVTGRAAGSSDPVVQPSVSLPSLLGRRPTDVTLTADATTVRSGKPTIITAHANSTVTGTDVALEIFDQTANTLIAACAQGNQCWVAYSAESGLHNFVAFATTPTSQMPSAAVAVTSNRVTVGWLDSTVSATRSVMGPGQSVTITATSTFDVRPSGRWLEIYDLSDRKRLTYCSKGTVCSTSMKLNDGGVHEIVGYVTGTPEAVSRPIYVTWLAVSLSATSIGPKTGGTVYLRATANADLTDTPWVVGIYDEQGRLVDHACKVGATCAVQAWMSGSTSTYTAVIGSLPVISGTPGGKIVHSAVAAGKPDLIDVQAKSTPVQPTHLLWGVDSCKAMTGDPSGQELFPAVVSHLGTPEFWGRYLTNTVCPGISSAEVALAARYHIGILPIYNDYDCSNVSYYATGHQYAVDAAAAARAIGIPKGKLIAIDIEPYGDACPGAGNVDSGFIEGWYDGIHQAGYVPAYYGNGTSGSEFASAWCGAVSALPNIAQGSDLWSFEPSLLGGFSKSNAPDYSPFDTGCAGNMLAWQYQLGSNSSYAEVDHDEALSSLPLWYPS